MMSKQAPMQSPSFSIRFKPASVAENKDEFGIADDVCDINDSSPSYNGGCEAVLFERVSNTEELASPIHHVDSKPVTHPGNLWKNSQAILSQSAPVSELTSPMSPCTASASPVTQEKPTVIKPLAGSQPLAEMTSIFSGLKEKLDKLSTESKEMFDRKMKRSGSADTVKIASLLADPDVTKLNVVNSEASVETTGFVAKPCNAEQTGEQRPEITEQSMDRDSSVSACCSNYIHKSTSSVEVAKADIVSSSATKLKRASLGGESGQEQVVMSRLLSSTSQSDSGQCFAAVDNVSLLSESSKVVNKKTRHATNAHQFKKPKRFISSARFRYLFSFLIAVVAYVIIPMPSYVSGMLVGAFLSAVGILLYQRLTRSRPAATTSSHIARSSTSIVADIRESKNAEGKFQGWMNELSNYNAAEFHINNTHSVYVTLESCTLRLQTPKHGIPKRAFCDEHIPMAAFVRQRHFDLESGHVYLLPRGLVNKRLWSKKYPICIVPRTSYPPADLRHTSAEFDGRDADCGQKQTVLYLFARTCRDKEEWYRRFVYASRGTPWPTRLSDVVAQSLSTDESGTSSSTVSWQKHRRQESTDSASSSMSVESASAIELDYSCLLPEHNLLDYSRYMSAVMPPSTGPVQPDGQSPAASMTWLSALIGRLFLDFLREKYWAEKMREKIQNKLCKMHVPHFINQLTVTGIELGCAVPSIRHVSAPYLDDRGFWLDVDVEYSGGFCLSMETKCNLMRLKCASSMLSSCINEESTEHKLGRCGAMYSDEEDSAESTTDEDNLEDNTSQDATDERRSVPMGKKLLQFVDKISQSRYFQQATEYKYIKRAMEEVSNTRLMLNVELRSIVGTLAINIPPPPTDRFWYGFRSKPELVLFAKPWVGDREVNLSPLTDWIEKKLAIEFQRVFVMPNMDDIPISLMCAHLQPDADDNDTDTAQ